MLEAFLPSMIEKNHGHIVALSSLAGLAGIPYIVPYSAAKFAVTGNFFYDFIPRRYKPFSSSIISFEIINNLKKFVAFTSVYFLGLMETLKDELRISSQGKSLIKFSTIYPYMSDTGLCKNPKINKS